MRKLTITLFMIFVSLNIFSKDPYEVIKISDDIEIIKLSEHSYISVSYTDIPNFGRVGSNGYIYVNKGEALLIDTPMTESLTKELVHWITDSLKVKLVAFVPNHWHNDCLGGLNYIHSLNIPSYANEMTIAIAKQNKLPVPRHGFKDALTLKIGNTPIVCRYYGPAHSQDNIITWIPSEKILYGGCMVKDLNSKNLGNTSDANVTEWPKTIAKLIINYPQAEIIIPGHGAVGGKELLAHTQSLLR